MTARAEVDWLEGRAGVDPGTGEIVYTSPLDQLAAELELATDAYASALDGEAVAHNAYERAHLIAFARLRSQGESIGSAEKIADLEAIDAKQHYRAMETLSKVHKAKVSELHARLVAAQSQMKWVGAQDGGAR